MSSWANWSGSVRAEGVDVRVPADEESVAEVLTEVAGRGGRVRPVGSGHSFSAVAAPSDVQLRLDRLTGVVAADPTTGRVRVRAGTPLHELNRVLAERGLALPNLGDIDRQTVAGAISTGTHGTGAGLPGIAAAVTALRLVTADGTILEITEANPDLLAAARVSLGALGIITEVELACLPAYRLRATERPAPLGETLDALDELAAAHRHVELYWFPHTDRALVKVNDLLGEGDAEEPLAPWRRRLDDDLLSNTVFGWSNRLLARVPRLVPPMNSLSARLLTARTYTGPSYEVFCTRREVRFHETEWAIPRAALQPALDAVSAWIERSGELISFPVEVRLAGADDAWLSTGYERENAYVACHHFVERDPSRYFDAVQEIMTAHDGRPHWGKMHALGTAELAARYPRHGDFVALRDHLDPARVLTNPYLDRVLGP